MSSPRLVRVAYSFAFCNDRAGEPGVARKKERQKSARYNQPARVRPRKRDFATQIVGAEG